MTNINRIYTGGIKARSDWGDSNNWKTIYEDSTFPARKDYSLYWPEYVDKNSM